jgi:hypothetical protein
MMADPHQASDLAKQVVLAAVNAAGPTGNNVQAWRAKIRDDLVPMIAAMLREGSPLTRHADDVMGSAVFGGEILGLELEESSKRVIVTFRSETTSKSDKGDDGSESIRTHRTDTAFGKTQYRRLQDAGVGAKLLFYKTMEPTGVAGREVRVLSHFDVLSTGQRDGPPPVDRPAQAPPDHPPASGGADSLMDRLSKLPGPVAGKVAKTYRDTKRPWPPTEPLDRAALEQLINEATP